MRTVTVETWIKDYDGTMRPMLALALMPDEPHARGAWELPGEEHGTIECPSGRGVVTFEL
jgi:hypothetical protein